MKKIIIISSIILGTVSFNYPVFDSEGISYIIILCCIVVITFSTAKIYFPDKEDYQSVKKKWIAYFNMTEFSRIPVRGFVYPKKAFEINDILAYRLITSTRKSID